MQMLKHTDMLIKEVADYLGFDDQVSFSHAFKKVFGKSPSAMKDHHKSAYEILQAAKSSADLHGHTL
jgi:AraC-like DNA-binding protein